MRAAVVLGALCAIGAMSSPLQKRVYETDLTIVTVTSTVTAGSPAPTKQSIPFEQKKESQNQAQATTVTSYYTVPSSSSSSSSTEATSVEPVTASSSATSVFTTSTSAVSEAPATTSTSSSSSSSSVITSAAATTSTIASSTTSSAAASTSSSTSSTSDDYQSTILENHNIHRSNHSASALSWSTDLESSAKDLADSCVYEHNTQYGGGGYGQNIGYGVDASNIGEMITNLMYNDEIEYFSGLYGEANPDMTNFEKWGHFSQIVWKGTTQVGCYTTVCSSLGNVDGESNVPFTVCNYSPAGNYAGEYADNIGEPLGNAVYVVS